mgnify:CR=1 FL=1
MPAWLLPALMAGAGLLKGGSKVAGSAAQGAASERDRQNVFRQGQDQAATSRYGVEQNARANLLGQQEQGTLDRAQLGLAAPDKRAGQVVRGSLMELLQPAKISHPRAVIPQMSGGLTPAALSSLVRQSGRDLQGQASQALQTKSDVPAMTDFLGEGLVEPPPLSGYQSAGKLESGLSGGALIASLLASLGEAAAGRGSKPTLPLGVGDTE